RQARVLPIAERTAGFLLCYMNHRPPTSTLFPYTTLFRSHTEEGLGEEHRLRCEHRDGDRGGRHDRRPKPWWRVVAQQPRAARMRSEEHTSELQSRGHLVCRLLLEKKNASSTAIGGNGGCG